MSTGPISYEYYNVIKTPSAAGSTANGSLPALGQDKDVLLNYANLLWTNSSNNPNVDGNGNALGNAYFYETIQQCTIEGTNDTTTRNLYINTIPTGMGGANGLLPGIIEDVEDMIPNPSDFSLSEPQCMNVTLEVVDSNGDIQYESNYVALADIQEINPCNFQSGVNPITNASCSQGFQNRKKNKKKNSYKYFENIVLISIAMFILLFILQYQSLI